MVAPPDKKESTTISMVAQEWEEGKAIQSSPEYRINGYPLRFVLTAKEKGYQLDLCCKKSSEAVLWKCTATITVSSSSPKSRPAKLVHIFQSWNVDSHRKCLGKFSSVADVLKLTVNIVCKEDGNSWRLRPTQRLENDGVLVIEGKEIKINKESLASQSLYFNQLLFGIFFKEATLEEIPIQGVGYKEFVNINDLIFIPEEADLNGENVHRVLELADYFELKIVEDSAVNFILSTKMPMKWKIDFAHRYHLSFITEQLNDYLERKFGPALAAIIKDLVGKKLGDEPVAETAIQEESTEISMIVNRNVNVQFSPVHRINGYSWHICVWSSSFSKDKYFLTLICDKNRESELWKCTATVTVSGPNLRTRKCVHTFESWEEAGYWKCLGIYSTDVTNLTVIIDCEEDGSSWRLRPLLNPSERLDGTLVIGKEKRTIKVNKKSLSSQSSYFHKHFFGGSEEKNEIFMEDAKFEEIYNIIHWLYHIFKTKHILTDKNILRVLELGRKFDLKIVEDRIICYILSSPMPLQEKIRIADQYKLPFIRDHLSKLEDRTEVYSEMQKKLSIDDLAPNQMERLSPVERFNGYDWRFRLINDPDDKKCVYLVCDISSEAALWSRGPCTAKVVHPVYDREDTYQFATWERQHKIFDDDAYDAASYPDRPTEVEVSIGRYRKQYPILDPLEPLDGILVFEADNRTIHVNKKYLAAQSPFFERLFGETKDVYEIEDVKYEEFDNLYKLAYNLQGASLTDGNVCRVLELADYFEMKIVKDRVVSFLLSSLSSMCFPAKILISDKFVLPVLMGNLLKQQRDWPSTLKQLILSPEFKHLSLEILRIFFNKFMV